MFNITEEQSVAVCELFAARIWEIVGDEIMMVVNSVEDVYDLDDIAKDIKKHFLKKSYFCNSLKKLFEGVDDEVVVGWIEFKDKKISLKRNCLK
ncbi:hypothetical protein RCL1_007865 [Eukaryota sp. TZLM3-RCL]